MRSKKVSGLLIAVALCMIVSSFVTAAAGARGVIDTEREASVSLTYRYDDHAFEALEIRIYRVAGVTPGCMFTLTGDFGIYPVQVNGIKTQAEWQQVASTLTAYVTADGISPTVSGHTNSEGKITFSGLETGLYLVLGCTTEYDGGYCTFDSYMLSLPTVYEGGESEEWIYDVTAVPKSVQATPGTREVEYTVNKVWKDSGFENKRPASIEVEIYKGTELVETVVLSSENDWTYSWTAPDDGAVWQVVERNIPEDYSVTIQRRGNTFIAANAYDDDAPPPQTGDTANLYLYVTVMCIAGIMLLIVGIALRRSQKHETR